MRVGRFQPKMAIRQRPPTLGYFSGKLEQESGLGGNNSEIQPAPCL